MHQKCQGLWFANKQAPIIFEPEEEQATLTSEYVALEPATLFTTLSETVPLCYILL